MIYTDEEERNYPTIKKENLKNSVGVCPHCKESNLEYDSIRLEGEQCYFLLGHSSGSGYSLE